MKRVFVKIEANLKKILYGYINHLIGIEYEIILIIYLYITLLIYI